MEYVELIVENMILQSHLKRVSWLLYTLSLLLLMSTRPAVVTTHGEERQDYCELDTFRANCPYSEVVMIEEASFGRMRLGSCLTLDVGYMGCHSDVQTVLDKLCSGRMSCEMKVIDLMVETNPCPNGLRNYLEVKYTCLPVLTPGSNCCAFNGDHISLEATEGVLASSITDMTGCGTYECPWILKAPKGQGFNFTLYDFAVVAHNTSTGDGIDIVQDENICTIYATIKDESSSNVVTVCAGTERITHVYTSASNEIELRILNHQGIYHPFLIKYEAMGCPDPIAPSYGRIERMKDKATVRCIHESETMWNITCQDGQWDSFIGNCTIPNPKVSRTIEQPVNIILDKFGPALVIIVIIAVAIIISITIMVAGITYLKRHRRNQHNMDRRYHASTTYSHRENHNGSFQSGVQTMPAKVVYLRKSATSSNMPWQYTRPLPQPGNYVTEPRRAYQHSKTVSDDEAKYYVLDPEISISHADSEVNAI